jgi:Tol biopolymer transport system component/DNA-binding winged helix-turn-helix (wHTH) protein
MASPAQPPSVIRFGAYELDTASGTLYKAGISVKLHPQPFRVLSLLAECPGQIVTREQIQHCLWGDNTFVDYEGGINFCVKQIRAALGDDPEKPRYIETLPRRGYRFIAPVESRTAGATRLQLISIPEGHRAPELRNLGGGETAGLEAGASQRPQAETPPVQISRANTSVVTRRLLIALASCMVLAPVAFWARPVAPPPSVNGVRQITHLGNVVFNQNLLVTGSRVYFMVNEKGESQIRYVSLDSDAVFPIEKPVPKIETFDISPSGNELLIGEFSQGFPLSNWSRTLWRMPVPTGTPRRVGNMFADDAAWSPDGRTIVYTDEPDRSLNLIDGDGSHVRKLASFPGEPLRPRWSPDGKLIRTSVFDPKSGGISLWQLDASGRNLTQMLPGWGSSSRAWTGRWTSDGRYFLFTGLRGGTRNIWALREKKDFLRRSRAEPVQLTDGAFDFSVPAPSTDSKRIYAVGGQRHGQLMRYNARSGEFEPYAIGLSADHLAFSRDGKWMAYVTYPGGALTRSRLDGSERLQLTFDPMRVANPQWSPDGSQIAFQAAFSMGWAHHIYVVSANGGAPRLAVPNTNGEQAMPNWLADGQSLLFASSNNSSAEWALHVLNTKTGKETVLPGTLGIRAGRVSPNGRYFAGPSTSADNLVLYDMVSGATRQLVEYADYPNWSPDGNYVYYANVRQYLVSPPGEIGVFRVKVADGSIERAAPAPAFLLAGNRGWWNGLAPDGSILVLRELGTTDIYALDADLP